MPLVVPSGVMSWVTACVPVDRSPAIAQMCSANSRKGDHGHQEGTIVHVIVITPQCVVLTPADDQHHAYRLLQMEPLHDRVLIKPIEEEPVSISPRSCHQRLVCMVACRLKHGMLSECSCQCSCNTAYCNTCCRKQLQYCSSSQ